MSTNVLCCYPRGGGAIGIWWVESRYNAQDGRHQAISRRRTAILRAKDWRRWSGCACGSGCTCSSSAPLEGHRFPPSRHPTSNGVTGWALCRGKHAGPACAHAAPVQLPAQQRRPRATAGGTPAPPFPAPCICLGTSESWEPLPALCSPELVPH